MNLLEIELRRLAALEDYLTPHVRARFRDAAAAIAKLEKDLAEARREQAERKQTGDAE